MTFSFKPETPLTPDKLTQFEIATPSDYSDELIACGEDIDARIAARKKQAAHFRSFIKDKLPEIQRQRYLDEQSQHE